MREPGLNPAVTLSDFRVLVKLSSFPSVLMCKRDLIIFHRVLVKVK